MEIRALRPDDLEQAWELDREAFHEPESNRSRFLEWQDPARFVGAFESGRLVALSGVHELRQLFGGRAVPMGGLTSVSVAPHRRGAGLGPRLVRACLEAMGERGQAISTLFPATTKVYRRLGWEVGGANLWRTIDPRRLEGVPRPEGVALRPLEARDEPARQEAYRRMTRAINGCLDRDERWWDGLRRSQEGWSSFVAEDAAGAVVGTLTYRQLDGEYGAIGGDFQLQCRDIVWNTREAAQALVGLLASWATQVETIHVRGGPEDPLLLVLPEQPFRPLAELRWMLRVVDAAAAVAERGYPAGVSARVPLALADDELPANNGEWTLVVEKGEGRLERGGPGSLRLGIGAFSSLYSGWTGTAGLARAGLLSGGSEDERAALDAVFAGPTPWMMDEF